MQTPKSSDIAFVTVVTASHLAMALALRDSLARFYGAGTLGIVVIDPESLTDPSIASDPDFIPVSSLQIPQWKRFSFQYTPFELCCSLKPFAMEYALSRGAKQVIYLDSDMLVYSQLESVHEMLSNKSIALTPHLLKSLPDDQQNPKESLFLSVGAFNGGLVGCQSDGTGVAFVQWWKGKAMHDCFVDVARGVFVDQKWLDLVPSLFDNFGLIRNPGCNTGYWTLQQFFVEEPNSGRYTVGAEPLECFHFSNFLPENPHSFLSSQSRFTLESQPALKSLVKNYHSMLSQYKEACLCHKTSLARLSDGTEIRSEWREAIRRNHPKFENIVDPFDTSKNPRLIELFRNTESESRRWRGDWQICSPRKKELRDRRRQWKSFWKHCLSRFIKTK